MGIVRISINDIPREGCNIIVDDVAIWDEGIIAFDVECQIVTPLRAELLLLRMQGGCLVRGTLTGSVVQPCDLCAEDAQTSFAHTIDTFVAIPGESMGDEEDDDDAEEQAPYSDVESHIIMDKHGLVLDLAALCWEEFMLALPMRPLCAAECKGLCATCGCNRNEQTCTCSKEEGDPRLAALRSLTINKAKD